MKILVNATQMKAIDDYAVEHVGIPSIVLMEKAAMSVAEVMQKRLTPKDKIAIVCGTGNNGGDGMALARILTQKGYKVETILIGDETRTSKQTALQYQILKNMDISILNEIDFSEYTIVVDAIFGIGLSKDITGIYEQVIEDINESGCYIYSIDIPSGISTDTGKVMNISVKANETITFGYKKLGLVFYPGCEYAGDITVADIGFPKEAENAIRLKYFTYNREDIDKLPVRKNYSNKGTFGRVLIIAGSKNMCGACFLSAKAAYRSGAGLVKVLTVEENRDVIQALLPEAIVSTYHQGELKNKVEVDHLHAEIDWANIIVMGPGIGVTDSSRHLLDLVIKYAKVPTVIDADAINLLAQKEEYHLHMSDAGVKEQINLPETVILTPHLLEMSRLVNCSVLDLTENLLQIAEWAVKDKEYTLALKDARTIVANNEKIYINSSGNNGMATGGSGDVLTGIIAALLAQGLNNFDATALGVYIHGLAADIAVEEKSKYSLVAGDIIEALPKVFNLSKKTV